MIELRGRSEIAQIRAPLKKTVFRLEDHPEVSGSFQLVSTGTPRGFTPPLLSFSQDIDNWEGDLIIGPANMSYLKSGDVIGITADGRFLDALWRGNGTTNTLLLTERCDNYCLMCSQPPRDRSDDWLLDQAFEVISLMPENADEIGLSGGEPTLYGSRFIELVAHVRSTLPVTALHILSNGRRFSDMSFASEYARSSGDGTMVGIPIYGAEYSLHDYVVQAAGAFDETVDGILNLGELGQSIEIRVVLHALTAPHIVDIARYIARNLPFVDQVALMGLEMMGLARHNLNRLWIEPIDYLEDLAEATQILDSHGIRTYIYNHQLCTLHPDIWEFAVKSISDWKNEYDPVCSDCDVVADCGGFFHSAKYGSSSSIFPVLADGTPKFGSRSIPTVVSDSKIWSRRKIPLVPVEASENGQIDDDH